VAEGVEAHGAGQLRKLLLLSRLLRQRGVMFLVVFRNRKRADLDAAAYSADADAMEALAAAQPGYLSFKSYTAEDGEMVALSEWDSEDAALGWRRVAEHAEMQRRGREEYYQNYTLFAGTPSRVHRFERPAT
jgi:heme-degrading monooxygenase HmoA